MNATTRVPLLAAVASISMGLAPPSWAVDFYLGAGAVRADTRLSQSRTSSSYGFSFKEQSTSWKAVVGMRALSIVGAELEYIDLGNLSTGAQYIGSANVGEARGSVKAASASGLLYLPIPLPLVDVYAKAGYARINATARLAPSGAVACPAMLPTPWYCGPSRKLDLDDNAGTAAVGFRVKLGSLGLGGEYAVLMPKGPNIGMVSITLVKHFL